jgi:hypothetical protein
MIVAWTEEGVSEIFKAFASRNKLSAGLRDQYAVGEGNASYIRRSVIGFTAPLNLTAFEVSQAWETKPVGNIAKICHLLC